MAVIEPGGGDDLIVAPLGVAALLHDGQRVIGGHRRGRIERGALFGVIAQHRAQSFHVILRIYLAHEGEHVRLVGVIAVQQLFLVVFAALVSKIRLLCDGVAVHRHGAVGMAGIHQLFGGHGSQLLHGGNAEFRKDIVAHVHGALQRTEGVIGLSGGNAAAFGNGVAEQPLGQRRYTQGVHAGGARGFARDGNLLGVAAEGRDIVVHPLQRPDLIQQAVVTGGAVFGFLRKLRVGIVAEHVQAIGAVHHDNAPPRQRFAVVFRIPGLAAGEGAAVDKEQHRGVFQITCGLPDIEIQ